jgi:hypothetical protein
LNAVLAPAKLIGLGRISAPKANARPVNFQRIAVDDGCLPAEIIRESRRGAKAYRREEQSRERHQCVCGDARAEPARRAGIQPIAQRYALGDTRLNWGAVINFNKGVC